MCNVKQHGGIVYMRAEFSKGYCAGLGTCI